MKLTTEDMNRILLIATDNGALEDIKALLENLAGFWDESFTKLAGFEIGYMKEGGYTCECYIDSEDGIIDLREPAKKLLELDAIKHVSMSTRYEVEQDDND